MKHERLVGLLVLLLVLPAASLIGSSKLRFEHDHYNATVFKYAEHYVLPYHTPISLPTAAKVEFRLPRPSDSELFIPEARRLGGKTFLQLKTTTLAGNSNAFSGTISVRVLANVPAYNATSSCLVHVRILTSIESCPYFASTSYHFSIDKDHGLFSSVGSVTLVDTKGIEYVLYLRNLSSTFTLHPRTGSLTLTSRPRLPQYRLRAIVIKPNTRVCEIRPKYTDVEVVIDVRGLDETPQLTAAHSMRLLTEVENYGQAGSVFGVLEAPGVSPNARAVVEDAESANYFEFVTVAPGNYSLRLRDAFNFIGRGVELTLSYAVLESDRTLLHGKVRLRPDEKTLLGMKTESSFERSVTVDECAPAGFIVDKIPASFYKQMMPGIKAHYSFYQDNTIFSIGRHSGELTVKYGKLDAEQSQKLQFSILSTDKDYKRALSVYKMNVRVLDCNEYAPTISNNNTHHTVAEDAPVGTVVLTVDADDADVSDNADSLVVQMPSGSDIPFNISGRNVIVSKPLDSETMTDSFTLYLRVSDRGRPLPRESLGVFTVSLLPRNEHRPEFEFTRCTFSLERRASMFETGEFKAVDLDYPQGSIVYELKEPSFGDCFLIDGTTGSLKLTCPLYRLDVDFVSVSIVAKDADGRESPALPIRFNIVESKVPDDGRKCVKHARSVGGIAADNEMQRIRHKRLVKAQEARAKAEFSPLPPNRPPKLELLQAPISVSESAPVGTTITTFSLSDADSPLTYNGRLQFFISSGNEDFAFNVTLEEPSSLFDHYTGRLVVLSKLDRELKESYVLNVTVCDFGQPRLCDSKATVFVRVLDVNDNAPRFVNPIFSLEVNERSRYNAIVRTFTVVDPDLGANGEVEFSVDNADFKIDSDGRLHVASKPDREKLDAYELVVRARDKGTPALASSVRLRVKISDSNDHIPLFISASDGHQELTISSATPPNTFLTRVIAVDSDEGDNARVSYSLSGDEQEIGSFDIDADSGCLHLRRQLPANRRLFAFTVVAADAGTNPKRRELSIRVRLVSAPPLSVYLIFNRTVYSFSIEENRPRGSLVGSVNAQVGPRKYQDLASVAFVVTSGNGRGHFSIDNQGRILTVSELDREAQPEGYWLTVQAYLRPGNVGLVHAEQQISFCQVFVSIRDLNDYRPMPVDSMSYRMQLVENSPAGVVLLPSIKAVDRDLGSNAEVKFAIASGNERGHFVIDEQTGRLTTTRHPVDREETSHFLLKIHLYNSGAARNSTVQVEVDVLDLNDSEPKFARPLFEFVTFANPSNASGKLEAAAGSQWLRLGRVVAYDHDLAENSTVAYSLLTRNEAFRIDKDFGYVECKNEMLHTSTSYPLSVMAVDRQFPNRSLNTVSVTVKVLPAPVEQLPPDLELVILSGTGENNSAWVYENAQLGSNLQNLVITGRDQAPKVKVIFTLSGKGSEDFWLRPSGGRLFVARALNRSRRSSYELVVSARHGVTVQSQQLTIRVLASNFHSPVFSKPVYLATVTETTKPYSGKILRVEANDPDPSESRPQYTLLYAAQDASFELFSISPFDGDLHLAKELDYETASLHELVVQATDNSRSSYAKIVVQVENSNEHYPVIIGNLDDAKDSGDWQSSTVRMSASVLSSASAGFPIAQVHAFDRDSGLSGQLMYSIASGETAIAFFHTATNPHPSTIPA